MNNEVLRKLSRGFTLIELLTVIAIIGILMAFLTANFIGVRQRSRDAQRKSDLRQIQSAFELYRSDNNSYPTSTSFPTCGSAFSSGGTTYMQKIPCDPTSGTSYSYVPGVSTCDGSSTPCTTYTLVSCIENKGDNDSNITTSASMPSWSTISCESTKYYRLDNP